MRFPRVRLTVRRMMVVVALAALVVEVEVSRRRYHHCRINSDRCASVEASHLRMAESHRRIAELSRAHLANPKESSRYNREQIGIFTRAAWEERARAEAARGRQQAFRRAALSPWSAIPPEEPEPVGPDRGIGEEELARLPSNRIKGAPPPPPTSREGLSGH